MARKGLRWFRVVGLALGILVFLGATGGEQASLGQDTPPARADYGDAPDELPTGYLGPTVEATGHFPTLFDTQNARIPGAPGAHALSPDSKEAGEWLGTKLSWELGPQDLNDPDGTLNFIDDDFDDGLDIIPLPPSLILKVNVGSKAPDITRYINILIDLDRNGAWDSLEMDEWIVKNLEVRVKPGEGQEIKQPLSGGVMEALVAIPSAAWMRIALTPIPIDTSTPWDGSGQFPSGEIEDYMIVGIKQGDVAREEAQRTAQVAAQAQALAAAAAEAEAQARAAIEVISRAEAQAQAKAEALAQAEAEAQAYASACAEASASAEASAQAIARAIAEARVTLERASEMVVDIPGQCGTVAINLRDSIDAIVKALAETETTAQAAASAAAKAQATAEAAVEAIAAARASVETGVQAIAEARARAEAAADTAVRAATIAAAQAQVVAQASVEAQESLKLMGISLAIGSQIEQAISALLQPVIQAHASAAAAAISAAQALAAARAQAAIALEAQATASAKADATAEAETFAAAAASAASSASATASYCAEAAASAFAHAKALASIAVTTAASVSAAVRECVCPPCPTITDITAPTMTHEVQPPPNPTGWNNTNVTVKLIAEDDEDGSGIKAIYYVIGTNRPVGVGTDQLSLSEDSRLATYPLQLLEEGIYQIEYWAVDQNDNESKHRSLTVRIDKTPPTITASRSPRPNTYGWNNSAVTVSFDCADNLSGVASCSPSETLTREGRNQSVTGRAMDKAGNTATERVSDINIDMAPPEITGDCDPPPNEYGWNNSEVTVSFDCFDSLSGVADCPSSEVITSEGEGQSVTGQAEDYAGNTASETVTDINIDMTPPEITGYRDPPPNEYGWNNTMVEVEFDCFDPLSGVAYCSPSEVITTEGEGQSVSGSAEDYAGNSSSVTITDINIDMTPPEITATSSIDPEGWVHACWDIFDELSGMAECRGLVGGYWVTDCSGCVDCPPGHEEECSLSDFYGRDRAGNEAWS